LDDPTRLQHVMTRPVEDQPILFATDASDNKIAFSTGTSVLVWDVRHNREPITVPRAQNLRTELPDITVSADGAVLAIATTAGVELWSIADHATPMLLQTIPGKGSRAAFSARRPLLATSDTHETTLWDTSAMIGTLRDPMVEACRSSTGPSEQEWQRYAAGVPFQKVCA
jgi:hypothetical protein